MKNSDVGASGSTDTVTTRGLPSHLVSDRSESAVGSEVARTVHRSWLQRNGPWLFLAFLSIGIAELLTGSTPLRTAFTNPLSIPFLLGYYGAGVLSIREISIRWRRGWASIVLLGLAYGILEEGLGTKTMFDPNSAPVGYLGVFGHLGGVNWVWSVFIALFHSLFSITLPILLFSIRFPEFRGVRLFSDRQLLATFLILVATIGISVPLFDAGYFEGYALLLAAVAVMVALVLAARFAIPNLFRPLGERPARSPFAFGLLGVVLSLGFFLISYTGPYLLRVPAAVVLLELGFCLVLLLLFLRWIGRSGHEPHLVAFAAGMLSFLFVFDVVLEFNPGEYGILLVTAVAVYLLVRLWVRVRRRESLGIPLGAVASVASGNPARSS